jgi:hypothetical protein
MSSRELMVPATTGHRNDHHRQIHTVRRAVAWWPWAPASLDCVIPSGAGSGRSGTKVDEAVPAAGSRVGMAEPSGGRLGDGESRTIRVMNFSQAEQTGQVSPTTPLLSGRPVLGDGRHGRPDRSRDLAERDRSHHVLA